MYEGKKAYLKMQNILIENRKIDAETYRCTVLKHDQERENIYLMLEGENLQNILLDAEYECQIILEPKAVSSKGLIRERYRNQGGNILCFHIESGFYEINIK